MNKELQLVLDDQKVAKNNAAQLIEAFGAPFTEAGEILSTYEEIVVTDESQKDLMAKAKAQRLALKKIRTTVENKRKELKEDSLRTGKAIDSVAKYIKDTIQPAENYLELQEKYAEQQETKRVAAIREERYNKLLPYAENPAIYSLISLTEEEFTVLFNTLKEAHDLKLAKEEAEKEQAKLLEEQKAAEDKRIREENDKLKAELEKSQAVEKAKEKEQQQLAAAPDKEKLVSFVNSLASVAMPPMSTIKTGAFAEQITSHLATTLKMYLDKIENEL